MFFEGTLFPERETNRKPPNEWMQITCKVTAFSLRLSDKHMQQLLSYCFNQKRKTGRSPGVIHPALQVWNEIGDPRKHWTDTPSPWFQPCFSPKEAFHLCEWSCRFDVCRLISYLARGSGLPCVLLLRIYPSNKPRINRNRLPSHPIASRYLHFTATIRQGPKSTQL